MKAVFAIPALAPALAPVLAPVLAIATLGVSAAHAMPLPMLYEEALAHNEEARIVTSPIAGVANKYWFDYQVDVVHAKKELAHHLGRADDTHDLRHAWEDYAHDLRRDRLHYAHQMQKRGYRVGEVTVGQ